MADLVQTPANVLPNTPFQYGVGVAGAAIVAGQPIYLNSDQRWYPASASGTAIQAGSLGIAIAIDSAPGAGQSFTYLRSGQINIGATLASGQVYVVSATTGNIAPISDITTGQYTSILGEAISTTILLVPPSGPFAPGVTHP